MRARRPPVLVAVALLLAAGGAADRLEPSRTVLPAAIASRAVMPTAAPASALSSSWFCVGGSAAEGSAADGVVVVANPTDQAASGRVTVVPAAGQTASIPVEVAPMSLSRVALRDVVEAPWAAAVVELDRGQVVAELEVNGPSDSDAAPCSSRASDRWYFADGATAKDANLALSLFNPFPEDAIVDLSFSTDQGRASPAAFRPIVVPARSVVVREIGEHVRRREAISTVVAVRTGRVVAAQTQTRTAAGNAGLSLSLGAPSLGTQWQFAAGILTDGVVEHYSVSNPSNREATVLFQLILDEGVAEDFERTVPAGGRLDVVLDEEAGVPRGVQHSLTVLSLHGEPVVVSRALVYAPPAGGPGRADTLGIRRSATRWLFAAGGPEVTDGAWLFVANTGTTPARISVTALDGGSGLAVEGLQDLEIGPGRRGGYLVKKGVDGAVPPLLLSSTAPVVVERGHYAASGGIWTGPGIPLD